MSGRTSLAILAVVFCLGSAVPDALAEDRHAGYYYPPPGSEEVYKARARTLPEASRSLRIRFVTGVTQQLQQRHDEVGQRLAELEADREVAASAVAGRELRIFNELADAYDGEALSAIEEIDRRQLRVEKRRAAEGRLR